MIRIVAFLYCDTLWHDILLHPYQILCILLNMSIKRLRIRIGQIYLEFSVSISQMY